MGRLRTLLEGVARVVLAHRQLILVAAIAVVILSPTWVLGLRIHADTAALVPRDDPIVAAYRRYVDRFGEPNDLVVRLSIDGIERAPLDEWTEAMAATIAAWPDILEVRSTKLPRGQLDAAWQLRAGLLNAGEAGRAALLATLDAEEIRRAALRTRRRVLMVGDPEARRAATSDPLGILGIAAEPAAERQPPLRLSSTSDFLDSIDGSSRLLIIRPAGSAEDGAYCRSLLDRIQEEAALSAESAGLPAVPVEFAGLHALTAGTMDVVVGDLRLITLVAFAGLLLLLWACFGGWSWLLLIFGPLVAAQAVFLGTVRLAFGPINYLSIGFAAVVLGLGLDFGLHLAARFDQKRHRMEAAAAIVAVMGAAGPPIVISGVTTMAAFACLSFSSIPYLVQFGLLTSTGLLVTLVVTLVVFPALAARMPPASGALSPRSAIAKATRAAAVTLSQRSGAFAAGGVGLAAVSLIWAAGFRFEMDLMRLFPNDLAAKVTQELLQEEFGGFDGTPLLLTLSGPSLDTVLVAQAALDARLVEERAADKVVGFFSPTTWLVSPAVDLDLAEWDAIAASGAAGLDDMRTEFEDLGLRWSPKLDRYTEMVAAATVRPQPIEGAADLEAAPAPLRNVLAFEADGGTFPDNGGRIVAMGTRVFVRNSGADLADAVAVRHMADKLADLSPTGGVHLEIAAITEVYGRVNESIRAEFLRLGLIALAVVLALTLAFLRKLRLALICFAPLLAAVPATLALARLGGVRLTPATVGFAAVVIGIGIDDAIHLVVRRVEQPRRPVVSILEEILPVITLTTLSTAVGFGVLTLSSLEPTRSIGVVTFSGVVFAWLFSWMLLPRLLRSRSGDRLPDDGGSIATGSGGKSATVGFFLLMSLLPPIMVAMIPQSTAAEQTLTAEQILAELEDGLGSMEAVTAELRQRVSYEQLTGEVDLEGTLFFQKPNLFRLELRGEQNLRVLSDGERIWLVDLDLEEVEVWDVKDVTATARLTRLFPLLNIFTLEDVQRDFNLSSAAAERGEHRLSLVPHVGSHSMAHMLIELDGRFRPVWTRVEYTNGDSLEIEFDGWRRRDAVSRHYFQEIRDR